MAPGRAISAGCFSALCFLAQSALAEPVDEQAQQIKQRIQAVQNSLGLSESRKDTVQGALGEAERRSGEIAKHLHHLDREVAQQQRQLAHLRQQKEKLLTSLRENNRGLDSQVRAAYMTGRREWLKLFLNPDDPARISRLLTYYGYLNRGRLAQLRNINEGLAEVDRMEQTIQGEKRRLENTQNLERENQGKLSEVQQNRESALAKLREELRDKSSRMKELEGNLRRLDRLVASADLALADMPGIKPVPPGTQPPVRPEGGSGRWPVTGPLLKRFGAGRMGGHWDGVLIKAAEGSPVIAAADGRVIFADWLRGYGLLLIVEHEDGYMSLYAFNQSLYKAVGERVKAGEVVSTVGHSGGRAQPSLYFGVRYAGRPVDPLGWLQKRG